MGPGIAALWVSLSGARVLSSAGGRAGRGKSVEVSDLDLEQRFPSLGMAAQSILDDEERSYLVQQWCRAWWTRVALRFCHGIWAWAGWLEGGMVRTTEVGGRCCRGGRVSQIRAGILGNGTGWKEMKFQSTQRPCEGKSCPGGLKLISCRPVHNGRARQR